MEPKILLLIALLAPVLLVAVGLFIHPKTRRPAHSRKKPDCKRILLLLAEDSLIGPALRKMWPGPYQLRRPCSAAFLRWHSETRLRKTGLQLIR